MKKTIAIYFVTAALFCLAGTLSVSAQMFGSSELVQAAKLLEKDPLGKDSEAIRGLAVRYVIETKDVSVMMCGGPITAAFLEKKNKNSTILIGQYTIGMAAFKLTNRAMKDDENAAQLAGLESTIRAYEAIIVEKPKTKFAAMDELVQKRDKGDLKALVESADCKKGS